MEFYILTLLVFACINGILAIGFDLQFGHAGILNFSYILSVAVGAYATAIAGVPPSQGFTTYIGGLSWAFPWTIVFGTVCSLLFAILLGWVTLRRLRFDYLALGLFFITAGIQVLILSDNRIFNGAFGITGIPGPGGSQVAVDEFQLLMLIVSFLVLCLVYLFVSRLDATPIGRLFRAVREDEIASAALGKDVFAVKMVAFVLGCTIAGLGGSLLATYASAWNVEAWLPLETIAILAAVMIGGRGNYLGAFVGSAIVLEGIVELSRLLPAVVSADLLPALQGIAIGIVLLVFLWWRPEGLLAERKERFPAMAPGPTLAVAGVDTVMNEPPTRERLTDRLDAADGTLLEVKGLSCSYGGLQAVKDVSFTVPRGSIVAIIGPNGAGKSTLIDCISGSNTSYSGTVRFSGSDVTRMPAHKIARLGLLRTFQVPRLFGRLTVLSNLMVAPRRQAGERLLRGLIGGWKHEELIALQRATALLERFQLTRVADNYGLALSGGQQRLVELSRIVMAAPQLVLLDEPFAGVSPANRSHLGDLLLQLQRDFGMTIVMVEHRLEMVERLSSDVLVMANGSVAARGTLAELRGMPKVVEAYLGVVAE